MWTRRLLVLSVFQLACIFSLANKDCPAGYFGEECHYQCHCTNSKCDSQGDCLPGAECEYSWFGPGCQYIDLKVWIGNVKEEWLRNNNDSSCNVGGQEINIRFTMAIAITWVRLILRSNFTNKDWRNSYAMALGGQGCLRKKEFLTLNTLDVVCANTNLIKTLVISGLLVQSLCSVYISGGRNVALFESTDSCNQVGVGVLVPESFKAVDGDNETCIKTPEIMYPKCIAISFREPVDLVAIFGNYKADLQQAILFINEPGNPEKEKPIRNALDASKPSSSYKVFWLLVGTKNTTTLRLESFNTIELCELSAFGETFCPTPTWYLNCSRPCLCANPLEKCHQATGMCSGGCRDMYHGMSCQLPCSPACGESGCDHFTGACYICPRGSWGASCEIPCNEGCLSDVCGVEDGVCAACDAGIFGPTCTQNCPEKCLEKSCDKMTGTCNECKDDEHGPYCNYSCPPECPNDCNVEREACYERPEIISKSTIVILVLAVSGALISMLLLLFCLGRSRKRKRHNAEDGWRRKRKKKEEIEKQQKLKGLRRNSRNEEASSIALSEGTLMDGGSRVQKNLRFGPSEVKTFSRDSGSSIN